VNAVGATPAARSCLSHPSALCQSSEAWEECAANLSSAVSCGIVGSCPRCGLNFAPSGLWTELAPSGLFLVPPGLASLNPTAELNAGVGHAWHERSSSWNTAILGWIPASCKVQQTIHETEQEKEQSKPMSHSSLVLAARNLRSHAELDTLSTCISR
jgi:hypothetical protein